MRVLVWTGDSKKQGKQKIIEHSIKQICSMDVQYLKHQLFNLIDVQVCSHHSGQQAYISCHLRGNSWISYIAIDCKDIQA
jgi:hypothetical protein